MRLQGVTFITASSPDLTKNCLCLQPEKLYFVFIYLFFFFLHFLFSYHDSSIHVCCDISSK